MDWLVIRIFITPGRAVRMGPQAQKNTGAHEHTFPAGSTRTKVEGILGEGKEKSALDWREKRIDFWYE